MATKQALRRTWFQVHKWTGLLLAALIIPISFTGAVLVWHEELEPWIDPARFATSGEATIAPDAYLAAARAVVKPGDRIATLAMPEHGGPVVVSAAPDKAPARPGPPQRTNVYLDPPTARVLEVAPGNAGIMRVFHVLHGSLLIPGVGRQIVGWIGVAMMLSAMTGLWLWFPPMGRWTRGFRWKRHPNTDTNLHYQFGFWIALPLFVLSLTGAWISFPAFFGRVSGEAPGGGQRERQAAARARPVEATRLDVGQVLAAAGGGAVRQVAWPTEKKPEWTVRFERGQALVNDRTGAVTREAGPQQAGVMRLMRRIHDGTGMGLVWRWVIFLGGMIPVGLAVTGVIMWWRARGWRAKVAANRRPRVRATA
jgi:uncharacterized iron-regulated membrane protein